MPFEPRILPGTRLGMSRTAAGEVVGNLYDLETGKLVSQASWYEVDEPLTEFALPYQPEKPRQLTPEERELIAEIAGVLVTLTQIAVEKATPHVKRVWEEKALPMVKTAWQRTFRRLRRTTPAKLAVRPEPEAFEADNAGASAVEVAMPRVQMTAEQLERLVRLRIEAGALTQYADEILARAMVVEGSDALDAAVSGETDKRELVQQVLRIIEQTPEQLADDLPRAAGQQVTEGESAERVAEPTAERRPATS